MTKSNQDPAIKTDDVRRIETDEAMANQHGLFFTDPTLFALGTPMWRVGQQQYEMSRKEFEQRPLVEDVVLQAKDAVKAQDRKDILVNLSQVQMGEKGRVRRDPKGGFLPISKHAIGQAVARAGGPSSAGSYLSACPAPLRATNFNHWMGGAFRAAKAEKGAAPAREPISAVFRTMLEDGKRGIYGVVSEQYKVYDAPVVIDSFIEGLPAGGRAEFVMEGPKWEFKVYFHSAFKCAATGAAKGQVSADDPEAVKVGDIFRGCVWVSGLDDGSGSIRVGVGVERVRCKNCTTIWARDVKGVRHNAKEIATKLAALVKRAHGAIEGFADKWNQAASESIINGIYEGVEPEYIFQKLVEGGHVKVTGCKREELVERLVTAWRAEPGYTRADISNAVSRAAHTSRWGNAWAHQELEEQAGELAYNYVVIAPPQQETEGGRFTQLEV